MRKVYAGMLPSTRVTFHDLSPLQRAGERVYPKAGWVDRSGQVMAVITPTSNWAWGLDASNNPTPVDANGTPIALPPGASQWGRARPVSDQTGAGPSTPVALDASGYPVAGSSLPTTGIMLGLTVLGLVIGYGVASSSQGTRMNPVHRLVHGTVQLIRNPVRHLRRGMRHAHRF